MELLPGSVQLPNAMTGATTDDPSKRKSGKVSKAPKEKAKDSHLSKDSTPESMAVWLANTKGTVIDVDRLKRLRLLLRNETAACVEVPYGLCPFTDVRALSDGPRPLSEVEDTQLSLHVSMIFLTLNGGQRHSLSKYECPLTTAALQGGAT